MNQGAKIAPLAAILKVMYMKLQGLLFLSTHLHVHCLPHLASVLGICLLNPKTCPALCSGWSRLKSLAQYTGHESQLWRGKISPFKLIPSLYIWETEVERKREREA